MMSNTGNKKQTLRLKMDEGIHYKLIGISSHENDYRLVWAINQQLKFQLVREENLIIHQVKLKTDLEFSRYGYYDEDRYVKYQLIANRCPDGFLFPSIKNIDFLLQVIGEISDEEMKDLNNQLKLVTIASAVFVLDPGKIKDIRKILPD
jgi:hypothetical protein